ALDPLGAQELLQLRAGERARQVLLHDRLAGRRARVGVDLQRGTARSEDRRARLPALVDDVDDQELLLPRPFERVRDAPDRCGTAGQHDLAEAREILLLGVDHDQRGVRLGHRYLPPATTTGRRTPARALPG